MSKVLFLLSTAFDVSDVNVPVHFGEKRTNQYVEGISKVFKFKFPNDIKVDYVLCDNTVSKSENINKRIMEVIPSHVHLKLSGDNTYGSINKGAGVLASWCSVIEILKNYDYIIHFEPRLQFQNYDFLNNFISNPRTLITIGDNKKHFNTGLFSFKTLDFISYINSTSAEYITNNKISIEYDIFRFVKEKQLDFDVLDKMNVEHHDSVTDKKFYV